MAGKGFRVVIVGGSIAGLTLALALEKNNIDFVVLEAYAEIAPQVGASIAILPNGFRILDQLGCFEDVLSKVNCTIDNFIVRDSDGKALIHVKDLDHHLVSRHGYPMIFFERRMVIEVLHQHIRQKNKVLTSKRVTKIEEGEDGVTAFCQDGDTFKGDVLIGADGIHSTVGQQIWQVATEKNPELKKEDLPVEYRCLFGISNKVPGISEDTLHHITNVRSSSFAASGPNERTYWCLFFNTGTTYYGDGVPPYTDKDEAETVRQHGNDAITESVKFSDLYDRKIMSVCTPLHEGVLGTWHSQRCMVVGDAVHKFNPIVGLGGMSAMETCSALTNNLVALLESNPASSAISTSAITSVFSATQSSRAPRAAALVAASRDTQHRFAMETTFLKILNRYIYPTMGTDGTLRLLSEAYPGAVSVESLPLPEEEVRARNFPYEDELRRPPALFRSSVLSAVAVAGLGTLTVLGSRAIHTVAKTNGTFPLVRVAVRSGVISELGISLRPFVQSPGLNRLLKTLVTVFLPVIAGDRGDKLLAGYFLVGVFAPLLAIMVVEGYRRRNSWSLLWTPSVWTGAAQLVGLGVILPLYVLAFFVHSRGVAYWMPAERFIPQAVSKAILPSVLLGFLVPSVLMIMLDASSDYIQQVIAYWQITPILVSWLTEAFSKLSPSKTAKKLPEDYSGLDLSHLRILYDVLFIISAVVHVAVLAIYAVSPGLSLIRTFVPLDPVGPVATIADGMRVFFQFDLLFVLAATFAWSILNILDLRRVGVSGTPVLKSIAVLMAGYVVVGPGAATVVLWKWREETMARPELKKRGTAGEKKRV